MKRVSFIVFCFLVLYHKIYHLKWKMTIIISINLSSVIKYKYTSFQQNYYQFRNRNIKTDKPLKLNSLLFLVVVCKITKKYFILHAKKISKVIEHKIHYFGKKMQNINKIIINKKTMQSDIIILKFAYYFN